MSETKWIPYDEKKDKRLNAPRPKVKHIKTFNNYPLAQFYAFLEVVFIGAAGWFLSLLVQSTSIGAPSDPITTQSEVYILKFLFCIVGISACSLLYDTKVTREEFIEDLQ